MTRRTLMLVLAPVGIAGMLMMSGCSTAKPKVAKDGLDVAQSKLAAMKSGAEWQFAENHFFAGDLEKAQKSVENSLKLTPNVAKAHLLRGRIMLERGRLEDARNSLVSAEELDPSIVDTQYFLGILSERQRKPEDALTRYTRASQLDANNAQYVIAAAEMHIQLGRLDEAERLLNERRSSFDSSAAFRHTQGNIAMLRSEYAKAEACFAEANMLAPKDARVLEDLVASQVASGRFADADVNVQKLQELDGNADRRDLKQLRARCLVAIDRPVEARSILQELTSDREGGRDVRSWTELGQVAAILRDRPNLRGASTRLIALAPDNPDGFIFKGMWYRLENKPGEALAAFDAALARDPQSSTSLTLKALALQDMGRIDEARQTLNAASQIDPGNAQLRQLAQQLNTATTQGQQTITSHPAAGN